MMALLKKSVFGFLFFSPLIMMLVASAKWGLGYFFNGMLEYNFWPFPALVPGAPVVAWMVSGGWIFVLGIIALIAILFYLFTRRGNFVKAYVDLGVEGMNWKQMLAMTIYCTTANFFLTWALGGNLVLLNLGATMVIAMYKIGID